MSLVKRLFSKHKRKREPQFEDYKIKTGCTNADHTPWAAIEEFFALGATAQTHDEAIHKLKSLFDKRIQLMKESGEPIPLPGSGKGKARFAPNDQIEALRPFVDEFWSDIFGTFYAHSFVSNESQLSSWEHYLSGGRSSIIQKVKEKYDIDISDFYDEPIPIVLRRIQEKSD